MMCCRSRWIGIVFAGAAGVLIAGWARGAEPESKLDPLLATFLQELVEIRPGEGTFPRTFLMGTAAGTPAEGPPREVTLTHSFWIARYEVPQNLYEVVMDGNPSRWKGPRNSVEMMSWNDAVRFCERMTQELRSRKLIGAGEVIRLPTEIEWEYCCRAGTTTPYLFGAEIRRPSDVPNRNSILDEYGWYTGNAAGNDPPVGALKPNPWGLYDVHGYLWEFTADPWTPTLDVKVKTSSTENPEENRQIVLRSGSWKDAPDRLTSTFRRPFSVTAADDAVGLRLVRSATP